MIPTAAQLLVRDHPSLSLLLVAPAGCGKTEALAMRIAGLVQRGRVAPPQRVLAATFTNRAKDNLRGRLRDHLSANTLQHSVTVTNFHGLAARVIKAHGAVIGIDPDITIPEGDWVKEQCRKRGLAYDTIDAVDMALRVLKQQPLDDAAVSAALLAQGSTIAHQLEQERMAQNHATYDDLLRLGELILAHDAVADLYRTHFGAVIVDEYQDLTPQQLRFINYIGEDRITFAGDLSQSIYGFTGAQPAHTEVAVRSACSTVVEFNESHRSSPAVLAMVNAINNITGGTHLTCAAPSSWPGGGLAATVTFSDDIHEGSWISGMCKHVLAAAPNHRIGLIARIKSRLSFVDRALESSGVAVHRWEDGVLDTDTAMIVRSMLSHLDLIALADAADQLAYLRQLVDFDSVGEPDTRRALAEALNWVLDRRSEGNEPAEIARRIKVGNQNTLLDAPGAHLLSGHVGKGQQFDWVVIIGAEDRTLPFFRAETADEVLEEARILSVMMSRARHGVLVTNTQTVPTAAGIPRPRTPSPFLSALAAASPLAGDEAATWLQGASWSDLAAR